MTRERTGAATKSPKKEGVHYIDCFRFISIILFVSFLVCVCVCVCVYSDVFPTPSVKGSKGKHQLMYDPVFQTAGSRSTVGLVGRGLVTRT